MSKLPKIAQKQKVSKQGQKLTLRSFIDDKELFSDIEDDNTESTEYELPTRIEHPEKK